MELVCGSPSADGLPLRPYLNRRELVQYLLKSRPESIPRIEKGVDHLSLLLISNPHWGVYVLRAVEEIAHLTAKCNIPDELQAIPSDLKNHVVFITPCPDLPFSCRAKLYIYTFSYYIAITLFAGAAVYGIFFVARRYLESAREEEKLVMALVEKILKQVSESCLPGQEYVAIRHVHDMLIRPADRPQMSKLWERAVQFLEKHESRVRREIQTVHGEDTAVWRWLTTLSNPPSPILSTPVTPQPEPTDNHLYPDLSGLREREGQRVWQGKAFETSMGSMNSSPTSPTPCLKIRHMFQPNKNYGPDWVTAVQDAIIEKCEGVRIVHIFVDSRSKEGCVYLKCSTPKDAGEAFGHLHGSWFDGLLVTVKFLRLERYHDRFPDSINCKTPLQPSNDLRLSLGKKASGEESEPDQHGGGGTIRRISMPPPANFRSRWKTAPKTSSLNTTIGDFRASDSPTSSLPAGRTRRTPRKSLRENRSGYDFESGSDTDYVERGKKRVNNSLGPEPRCVQKDSRLFLTNFSKRYNSFGNDVNDIKETDSDNAAMTPPRTIYPFRGLSVPVKPFYDPPENKETCSLFSQLQQYGSMAILALFLLFFIWLGATYCLRVYLQRPLIAGKPNHVYPLCKDNEIGMEKDEYVRYANLLSNVVDFIFYPIDHIAWAIDHQIIPSTNSKWSTASTVCWAISLYLTIAKSMRSLFLLSQEKYKLTKTNREELAKLNRRQRDLKIAAIRAAGDLIFAVHYLP